MTIWTGADEARPFIPAKDFALSRAFYERLGFKKIVEGEVAVFQIGSTSFILQNYYQKDWADNFMMQLVVDDLDAVCRAIEALDLSSEFGVPLLKPPALQPWGLRVAYLTDPAGVLWHLTQR